MSIKVLLVYGFYLLALMFGLGITLAGAPLLFVIFVLSISGGVGFETLLIGLFALLWVALIPVVFVKNMNRMLKRGKECADVGGSGGLKLFFDNENGFDDFFIAIGVMLSGLWFFSATIWYPSFFPEINSFVGVIGVAMFLAGMIPTPGFLKKINFFFKIKNRGKTQ